MIDWALYKYFYYYYYYYIIKNRFQQGAYHNLVKDLQFDEEKFQQYFWLTREQFDQVLCYIEEYFAFWHSCLSERKHPTLTTSSRISVAYPELVSRGVSKSRNFKWLVKVGACKDVNPLI